MFDVPSGVGCPYPEEQEELQGCAWHEEYGSWMLEGTPRVPYGGYAARQKQPLHFECGLLTSDRLPLSLCCWRLAAPTHLSYFVSIFVFGQGGVGAGSCFNLNVRCLKCFHHAAWDSLR